MSERIIIYEINTRVWLNTLSRHTGKSVTLATVPDEAIDDIARYGITHVWLMGVWERSELGQVGALRYKHEYVGALPDLTDDDVIGSAYSIRNYEVAAEAGGRAGMAALRKRLKARGMGLIVDYVPNHVALDHPWVIGEDSLCVRGTQELLDARPGDFFASTRADDSTVVTANGRDPNFPPWNDTAQLNAFSPALRAVTIETLRDIASQADAVRCDMAMLFMSDTFSRTWDWLIPERPNQEYWMEVIPAVREQYPDFLFMAEAYWDLEYALQQQGFDYTYDKRFYDRLRDGDVAAMKKHLSADIEYQRHTIRFIENHDEPRAAVDFGRGNGAQQRMAIGFMVAAPGALLLHDGQFSGRRIKLPVQITREMDEMPDADLEAYYDNWLQLAPRDRFQRGDWSLLPTSGAIIAFAYSTNDQARLMIANITGDTQKGTVQLGEWGGRKLVNMMTNQTIDLHHHDLPVEFSPYTTSLYEIDLRPEPDYAKPWHHRVRDAFKAGVRMFKGDGSNG
jgi:glycosidase